MKWRKSLRWKSFLFESGNLFWSKLISLVLQMQVVVPWVYSSFFLRSSASALAIGQLPRQTRFRLIERLVIVGAIPLLPLEDRLQFTPLAHLLTTFLGLYLNLSYGVRDYPDVGTNETGNRARQASRERRYPSDILVSTYLIVTWFSSFKAHGMST